MSYANTAYTLKDHDLVLDEKPYQLRVRDLPSSEKPREKLYQFGPSSLSTAELMAVMLGVGTRKEEVMAMSKRIVAEYGEKAIINETNPQRLADALGIPLGKAYQIIAASEFGRRMFATSHGKPVFIRTAGQAFLHVAHIGHMAKEQLRGIYLNSRHEVIHEEIISIGSMTSNIVHPREVYQPALNHGAVAIILAHNHPSGTTSPTDADYIITSQLRAAGQILGIELLDHLVIAGTAYESCMNQHE